MRCWEGRVILAEIKQSIPVVIAWLQVRRSEELVEARACPIKRRKSHIARFLYDGVRLCIQANVALIAVAGTKLLAAGW